MRARVVVVVGSLLAFAAVALDPGPARAQSAGSVLGGLAGGVLGGMIAGSIAANARPRTVVVYDRRRSRPAPRVARVRRGGPAAPGGQAEVINASADPFSKGGAPATTAVSNTH